MKMLKYFKSTKLLHKKTKYFTFICLIIFSTEVIGRFIIFNFSSGNSFFLSFLYENRISIKNKFRDIIYTKQINSKNFKNTLISRIKDSNIDSFNLTLSKNDRIHFQEIIDQMEENASRGTVEEFNTYRKIKLHYNGNKYDAKIKLHLGEPRHWQDPKKSYSLKLSKGQYINRMEKFDFVVPEDRGYFPPLLCKQLSHFTNLPHPENAYGILYINDTYNGVYLIEEEFDNNPAYFEKNKLPNDFSIRPEFKEISELVLWDSDLAFWDSSSVQVQSPHREKINDKLDRYLRGLESMDYSQLSKMVDVEKVAALCAINIFWGYSHDYIERNIRLVYSLDSGLIYYQPRAEDGAKLLNLDSPHYPSAERLQSFEHGMNYFYSAKHLRMFQRFLRNNQFRDKRNHYLKKIFQEYKIEKRILEHFDESLEVFPLDPFTKFNNQTITFLIKDQKDTFLKNAKNIKDALSKSSLFIKVFKSDQNLSFSILADSLARLMISDFKIRLPKGIYNIETIRSKKIITVKNDFDSVSLDRFFDDEYLMADLDFKLHPKKTFFKISISGNSVNHVKEEDVSISAVNTFSGEELPSRRIHINVYDNKTDFTKLRSLNVNEFIRINSLLNFTLKDKNLILNSGSYRLNEDLVIPEGLQVEFESNTTITLEQNRSIISYSPINFNGTENAPVIIKSENSIRPFGTVAIVLDKKDNIEIKNLKLIGGSDKFAGGIFFNGALSIHNANIRMDSCTIKASKGDDGINFKNSVVEIKNCHFIDNFSDHMDLDFCEAIVQTSKFNNPKTLNYGDSIDLSGSYALIINNNILKSGDKGISVGENSKVVIKKNSILENAIGIAVKDLSNALISENLFDQNQKNLSCYSKKGFFGGGTAFLNSNINLAISSIWFDDLSDLTILNTFYTPVFTSKAEEVKRYIFSVLDSIKNFKN